MKYTYIFLATDPEMSNHRLRKLVNALRLTTTVSWKYAGNADMLTEVQCFVDGPTVYHLLSSAGIDSDAWDSIIKAARRNGDVATGRAEEKLNALRRRHRPLVPSGAHKEQKRTYIFIQGKDGITHRTIDDMREAMGLRGRSNIDRWEVRVTPKEMFDASRAANVPGSAVVGARQRADSLHKQVMHGIRYSTPMRIEGPTLWMAVALDRLRKAGCDIKVYLIPPMSYEIVVFGEVFALESSSEARGFLAGLEKGLASASASPPLQMPGGTKRSKRSA